MRKKELFEILGNWNHGGQNMFNEFHGRKEVEELMQKHNGFHDRDNIWIVKDKIYVYIFKVWYGPETSMFPQSENNEIGHIEYCFKFPIETFESALTCLRYKQVACLIEDENT